MIKRRSKLRRGLTMIGVAFPSILGFAGGMWRKGGSRRWMVPLVILLCLSGLLLILGASVEALAPFIYTIF